MNSHTQRPHGPFTEKTSLSVISPVTSEVTPPSSAELLELTRKEHHPITSSRSTSSRAARSKLRESNNTSGLLSKLTLSNPI